MSDQKRKLAVIVFTDIVGFTKLTSQDQQKASDLLDTQRKEFSFLVKSFQGKWVKEMGDGLILTFDTISKAVRCCVKMQQRAKTIEHLNLRIGMHTAPRMDEKKPKNDNNMIMKIPYGSILSKNARPLYGKNRYKILDPSIGGIGIKLNTANTTLIMTPYFIISNMPSYCA